MKRLLPRKLIFLHRLRTFEMQNLPLRIAWDNSLAGRDRSGTGVYAANLIQALRKNVDVKLEVFERPNWADRRNGIFGRAAGALAGLMWAHWQLPRRLRQGKYDLLHGPAFVAPPGDFVRTVVTIHDLTVLMFPQQYERSWRQYVTLRLPAVLKSASAAICVSEQTKQDLLKLCDISDDKVHVVYNGIDHLRFHPNAPLDPAWARQIGIRDGYLLHVGAFAERKNIPTLLRAIAGLRSEGKLSGRQLVLAGSQLRGLRGAPEVFNTIRELDLAESIVFAGHVPDANIPGLYSQASLLVMPSWYEGFGFPVLEAMATGTPVVASNTSSLPEVAGGAAILFSPNDEVALADSIHEVLSHPILAQQLRNRGIERASEFSWERTAKETISVYRSVAR